jgi:hypothetical protein
MCCIAWRLACLPHDANPDSVTASAVHSPMCQFCRQSCPTTTSERLHDAGTEFRLHQARISRTLACTYDMMASLITSSRDASPRWLPLTSLGPVGFLSCLGRSASVNGLSLLAHAVGLHSCCAVCAVFRHSSGGDAQQAGRRTRRIAHFGVDVHNEQSRLRTPCVPTIAALHGSAMGQPCQGQPSMSLLQASCCSYTGSQATIDSSMMIVSTAIVRVSWVQQRDCTSKDSHRARHVSHDSGLSSCNKLMCGQANEGRAADAQLQCSDSD